MLNIKNIMLGSENNIDEYIDNLIYIILTLKSELDTIVNWHNNDWIEIVKKKREINDEMSDKWFAYEQWITKYIYTPKRYEFCVYLRTFLNSLKIYLKGDDNRDYARNKEMWESSQCLRDYIDLIFKNGVYEEMNDKGEWELKIFNSEEEIVAELEELISFISKALHGFPIYFSTKNNLKHVEDFENYMNKKIYNISNLIFEQLAFWKNIMDHKIESTIEKKKEEYDKLKLNIYSYGDRIKYFLNFIKNNCLNEDEKSINTVEIRNI